MPNKGSRNWHRRAWFTRSDTFLFFLIFSLSVIQRPMVFVLSENHFGGLVQVVLVIEMHYL